MTEDEKIRKVIERYEGFFQNTISDVAQTKKGVWIFFEYDAEHEYYNSFFQFSTAGELEQIIVEVLADEVNILIETTAENIQLGLQEFDINEAAQSSYGVSVPELLKNIEVLNSELQKGVGFVFSTANIRAMAVIVFSPPESRLMFCSFLPGGWAIISIPDSRGSFSLSRRSWACPPPKSWVNTFSNWIPTC